VTTVVRNLRLECHLDRAHGLGRGHEAALATGMLDGAIQTWDQVEALLTEG
jgi:hypothetical protein